MAESNTPQIEPDEPKKTNLLPWLLLLLTALAGGYFFWQNQSCATNNRIYKERIIADSAKIVELDAKYSEVLNSLNTYKGLNVRLDSIIAVREQDLKSCRTEFLSLLSKNQVTESNYKKQMSEMTAVDSTFKAQLQQMQDSNQLLRFQRDSLGRVVMVINDSLVIYKDSTASLSQKVTLGSLLKPSNINVQSTRSKNNNKDAKTKKASKTDQLKICFDIPENPITPKDTVSFYIRIINPDGNTLASETSTRMLTRVETQEQIPYSTRATVSYHGAQTVTCVYFRQNVTYTKGTYTIEIYQYGYLVGTTKFALK